MNLNEKKAIIILPGILGSNLYDANTDEILWPKINLNAGLQSLMSTPDIMELINFRGERNAFNWIDRLSIDDNGKPVYPCKVKILGESDTTKYGKNDRYKDIYLYLRESFKDEYDVRLFEYDWRLSNLESARELEKFVERNHYDKIVLVCHSMGGIVASTYIAKSEANQNKVIKFVSIGTPFFGTPKAVSLMEDMLLMLGIDKATFEQLKQYVDMANGAGSCDELSKRFLKFVYNISTIYQLMPTDKMMDCYQNKKSLLYGHGIVDIDGEKIDDYLGFYKFLSTKKWANKRYLRELQDLQNRQYLHGQHSSKIVDTTYIVGNGINTCSEVRYSENGNHLKGYYPKEGDGMVPLYSASCGEPIDSKRVKVFDGITHNGLVRELASLQVIRNTIEEIKR